MNDTLTKLYALRASLAVRTEGFRHGGYGPPDRYQGWRIPGDTRDDICSGPCLMLSCPTGTTSNSNLCLVLSGAALRLFPDRCLVTWPWENTPWHCGVHFNNHPDTTHADILMVIDAAIVAAGGEVPMNHPERSNKQEPAHV